MGMHYLDDDYIRARPRPTKGYVIDYDTGPGSVKGFAVRFTPTGTPTFLFCYGIPGGKGAKRRMVLREWRDCRGNKRSSMVNEARDAADALRVSVKQKVDPYIEQRKAAEERAEAEAEREAAQKEQEARLTIAQLCELYADPEQGPKLRPDTLRRVRRRMDRYLIPKWGDRKADTITDDDVLDLLKPVRRAGKRAEAVHVLSAVSGLYSWAITEKILPLSVNPAKGIKSRLQKANELPESRDRALATAAEFRALWHVTDVAADISPGMAMHPDVADCLRFMLFTGARPSEAAGLRWCELDLNGAVWNKPKQGEGRSKSSRGDTLPLVGPAMAIVRSRLDNGSEYVFPSGRSRRVANGGGEGCLTANRLATGLRQTIPYLASLGIEPFTPHDVRRTLATGMNEIGVSSDVVERTLNHSMSTLKKTYDKSKQTRIRRRAMEAWVSYFAEVVRTGKTMDDLGDEELPQTDNVLQFPQLIGGR